jgi:hypothetical protein
MGNMPDMNGIPLQGLFRRHSGIRLVYADQFFPTVLFRRSGVPSGAAASIATGEMRVLILITLSEEHGFYGKFSFSNYSVIFFSNYRNDPLIFQENLIDRLKDGRMAVYSPAPGMTDG